MNMLFSFFFFSFFGFYIFCSFTPFTVHDLFCLYGPFPLFLQKEVVSVEKEIPLFLSVLLF